MTDHALPLVVIAWMPAPIWGHQRPGSAGGAACETCPKPVRS